MARTRGGIFLICPVCHRWDKDDTKVSFYTVAAANKVHFNKQRTNLLQPFYRQPGYGGRAVDRTDRDLQCGAERPAG